MPHRILSVDDDAAIRGARNKVLREAGFEVGEVATGGDALKLASEKQPALIVGRASSVPRNPKPGTVGFLVNSKNCSGVPHLLVNRLPCCRNTV